MSQTTDSPPDREEMKQLRYDHPSGWLYLTRHESVPLIVDALLDFQPRREFNKSELARQAGLTRQTVGKHISVLLELDIVEEVQATTPQRYRVAASEQTRALHELNSALNAVSER
ncbi:helix-turn-helix domain-containing protein [Halobacteria archaeon AArc-m2/3/4]|uniref:Helix-turn-helix domain-containing protein n=1 Tax=Natronoglomus mannanivorans TaxID=2979990 RepID=A0AAP2YY22_9EURY|nr:helix-turn-helix domain-containing protein [Halobacteria archaeon AArc-xg1-1]MCU4972435.1 helix-turn-helix domain-containing protein [Halobacteria archaeon AArc-m2/3/4]